jgi:DNA-binding NarL/FixJ family response regulator
MKVSTEPPSIVIVSPRAAVRARLRAALESDGVRVAGEAETLDEAIGIEPSADAFVVERDDDPDSLAPETLTPREREVLEWLAEGLTNGAIAARLGISDHTVKFHVASIYGKLGVSTRAEAIRRGLRRGFITI